MTDPPDPPDPEAVAFAHRMFDLARDGAATELAGYIDAGVPVGLTDADGNTLLMLAAYHGHPEAVRALLARGADAARGNDRGQTPLAGAVFKKEPEVVVALLAAGADPSAGTPSALATAELFGDTAALAVLRAGVAVPVEAARPADGAALVEPVEHAGSADVAAAGEPVEHAGSADGAALIEPVEHAGSADVAAAGEPLEPAGSADVAALVVLVESAYRGEASRAGWTTEADLLAGQRTDEIAMAALVAAGSVLLMRDTAGTPLACCQLEIRGATAYFGTFAVRPGQQGAGVGGRLLAEAERRAAGAGCQDIEMTVIEQRADLIAWYRRRGYQPNGQTRPFPYGDERFGRPLHDDLRFVVLTKRLREKLSG